LTKNIIEGEKMVKKQKQFRAELWNVYDTQKYVIAVYRVIPEPTSGIEEFYIVTIDTGACDISYNGDEEIFICETVVGAGVNPWEALMNAADAWDRPGDGRPNPFRQILESSQSSP
jgi:hypothetical protein